MARLTLHTALLLLPATLIPALYGPVALASGPPDSKSQATKSDAKDKPDAPSAPAAGGTASKSDAAGTNSPPATVPSLDAAMVSLRSAASGAAKARNLDGKAAGDDAVQFFQLLMRPSEKGRLSLRAAVLAHNTTEVLVDIVSMATSSKAHLDALRYFLTSKSLEGDDARATLEASLQQSSIDAGVIAKVLGDGGATFTPPLPYDPLASMADASCGGARTASDTDRTLETCIGAGVDIGIGVASVAGSSGVQTSASAGQAADAGLARAAAVYYGISAAEGVTLAGFGLLKMLQLGSHPCFVDDTTLRWGTNIFSVLVTGSYMAAFLIGFGRPTYATVAAGCVDLGLNDTIRGISDGSLQGAAAACKLAEWAGKCALGVVAFATSTVAERPSPAASTAAFLMYVFGMFGTIGLGEIAAENVKYAYCPSGGARSYPVRRCASPEPLTTPATEAAQPCDGGPDVSRSGTCGCLVGQQPTWPLDAASFAIHRTDSGWWAVDDSAVGGRGLHDGRYEWQPTSPRAVTREVKHDNTVHQSEPERTPDRPRGAAAHPDLAAPIQLLSIDSGGGGELPSSVLLRATTSARESGGVYDQDSFRYMAVTSLVLDVPFANCCTGILPEIDFSIEAIVDAAAPDVLSHPAGGVSIAADNARSGADAMSTTFIRAYLNRSARDTQTWVDDSCYINRPSSLRDTERTWRNMRWEASGWTLAEAMAMTPSGWAGGLEVIVDPSSGHVSACSSSARRGTTYTVEDVLGTANVHDRRAVISSWPEILPTTDFAALGPSQAESYPFDFSRQDTADRVTDFRWAYGDDAILHEVFPAPDGTLVDTTIDMRVWLPDAPVGGSSLQGDIPVGMSAHNGAIDVCNALSARVEQLTCRIPPGLSSSQFWSSPFDAGGCAPGQPGKSLAVEVGVRTNAVLADGATSEESRMVLPLECTLLPGSTDHARCRVQNRVPGESGIVGASSCGDCLAPPPPDSECVREGQPVEAPTPGTDFCTGPIPPRLRADMDQPGQGVVDDK